MMGIFLILLAFSGQVSAAETWNVNDVSFLLPLPANVKTDPILVPETQGDAGSLLPQRFLDLLPPLAHSPDAPQFISELAVVGIRIDPCFPGIDPSGEPCRSLIRMVWQPLVQDSGTISTADTAIHSFYELSASEFDELTRKLSLLNSSSGVSTRGLPLQIHPALAGQGLPGTYWQQLRAILLSYTGDKRLTRFTFMTLEAPKTMWDFGGFDVDHGKITRMVIPRVQTRLQSLINASPAPDAFSGGEKPEAPGDTDTFNRILERSSDLTSGDASLLRANADSIFRIENPKINSPATIDCASCHAAQAARIWAETKFPDLHLGESQFKFQSSLNLQNVTTSLRSTHSMRAFGYEGRNPAISQRTVNESAAIAETLGSKR